MVGMKIQFLREVFEFLVFLFSFFCFILLTVCTFLVVATFSIVCFPFEFFLKTVKTKHGKNFIHKRDR